MCVRVFKKKRVGTKRTANSIGIHDMADQVEKKKSFFSKKYFKVRIFSGHSEVLQTHGLTD